MLSTILGAGYLGGRGGGGTSGFERRINAKFSADSYLPLKKNLT